MEFFWYDFETLGRNPRVARAAQFFGIRTDAELNEISRTETIYCRPSLDWLPVPASCAVHALTTDELSTKGIKEADFARRIHAELSQPGTCAVGYNATRFDHEVTRFLFWRTLRDPYAWHWRHGNAKWDLIDLMRAAFVLRPQGIMWPKNEEGKPTFRLHALASANDVEHVPSHTADADVLTLIALARLVRSAQPKLFDYYLALRSAKEVSRRMEDVFLWISGRIAPSRGCVTLMAPLGPDPAYTKRQIAFDLAVDPLDLAEMLPKELETRLFGRDQGIRPVHAINTNGSPFVVERDYLTGRTTGALDERAGLDAARMWERERELRQDRALCRRLVDAWTAHQESRRSEATDVDEALYEAFVPDWDRRRLEDLHERDPTFADSSRHSFQDSRLPEVIFRYRARNYFESLTAAEKERWLAHCRQRHLTPDENGQTALDCFFGEIRKGRESDPEKNELWDDLESYGRVVKKQLSRARA